jgi:hypothetical protein
VLSTVRTAISAPVFSRSSVSSAFSRVATAGPITPASSVTKPRVRESADRRRARSSPRAGRRRSRGYAWIVSTAATIRSASAEVARELRAKLGFRQPAHARAVVEDAAKGRQGAEDVLARGQHVGIAIGRVVATQVEHVAQDHEERLQGADEQSLEIVGTLGGIDVERTEAQELPTCLALAFAPHVGALHDQVLERVRTDERPVGASGVVELHGERVARSLEELFLHDERQREAAPAPAAEARGEGIQESAREGALRRSSCSRPSGRAPSRRRPRCRTRRGSRGRPRAHPSRPLRSARGSSPAARRDLASPAIYPCAARRQDAFRRRLDCSRPAG